MAGESSAGSSGADGGQDNEIDIGELTRDYQTRMGETQSALERSNHEIQQLRDSTTKSDKVLEGLRRVLSGDEGEEAADPVEGEIAGLEAQIDQYLTAAVQAERAGRPIPLTVNAAVQSLRGQIEAKRQNQSLLKEIAQLRGTVDRVAHPEHGIDQQAFSDLDSKIINALETVYGTSPQMQGVKTAQWKAISELVSTEIKALRKKDPAVWDRIRRNPKDRSEMVAHFVKQAIPPRARQILEDEQVRNTPLTLSDLWGAWNDTKELKDPQQAIKLRQQLRPQILEMIAMKGRGGGGGINKLYREG